VRDETFRVIPVLLPGTERPRRGDVAHLEFLINASWVEFLKTLDDEHAFRSLLWGITGIKTVEPDPRYEGVCPYRGLEAFRPEDAKFFFGRQKLTGWLVSALRREVRAAQGVRFLGVLGPSGSGKSSVVLAGLVSKLQVGRIEGSERWPVVILRPGADPLKNLAAEVVSRFLPAGALPDVDAARKLISNLRADSLGLDLFAQLALRDQPGDVRLAVVVDQFEEVFTYRPQDDEARQRFEQDRDRFIANLLQAAAAPGGRVAVVLTMRSDFLSACATFPQLAAVLSAHQELVGPMTVAELREAIEQPAFRVGCEVERALTERLLADVEGRPGALPLLQFALTEVWKKRDVRKLTLRAYTELGNDDKGEQRVIERVLDRRADEIYRNLQAKDQNLCRRLFLRLVQPGEGTEDTKRRVPYSELLPRDEAQAEATRKLIRTLTDRDARLLATDGTQTAEATVEVAHEALIRGWTQLRQWVDAERAGLRTRLRLTEAAQHWADAAPEAKDDFLYTGAWLAVASEWVQTHRGELNSMEAAFLAASEEAEQQRVQTELENERRLRAAAETASGRSRGCGRATKKRLGFSLRLAAAVAGVLAIASVGLTLLANKARNDAENELARAEINDYFHRISLADRDWSLTHFPQALELLEGCPESLRRWEWNYLERLCHAGRNLPAGHVSVAFSPDNRLVAAASWKNVRVWEDKTGQELPILPGRGAEYVTSVAFAPDGKIASGSMFGTINIWDAKNRRVIFAIPGSGMITGLAFRSDGKQLASATTDGTVKLWDLTAGGKEAPILEDGTRGAGGPRAYRVGEIGRTVSVAFSPDGKLLAATGSNEANEAGVISVWNTCTGRKSFTLAARTDWNHGVAFRRDAKHLASASADGVQLIIDSKVSC
jgi:hypothetical protein